MPEYSSTTITPADGVKTPAMNGSTSGNYTLSALRDFILASKGQANGLASLDENGKLPVSQLPDLADDVIVVASYATLPATGVTEKIYITADNNKMFRWDSTLETPDYVELSVDLSDYATLSDLQDEEDAREAEDSRLKDAIDKANAEIENLKQTSAQTEITVSYPDDGNYSALMPNLVPQKSAKYSEIKSINGKARAWNQLISVSSGTTTLTGYGQFAFRPTSIPANHAVLVSVKTDLTNAPKSVTDSVHINVAANGSNYINTNMNRVGGVATGIFNFQYADSSIYLFSFSSSSYDGTDVLSFSELFVRDLNPIFPELTTNEIISLGISNLVKLCPDLLKYDAYGYSKVDTTVEGVRSEGVNIWDEEYIVGKLNGLTGVVDTSVTTAISSKNFIKVSPNTAYYLKLSSADMNLAWYDANYNYISGNNNAGSNTTRTSPNNAMYAKLGSGTGYGNTYKNDIQICLDSYADKTTYHPYMTDTLTLPSSVTLRSAGNVAEIYDLETGEKTNPLGEYTFTGNEVWTQNNNCYQTPSNTIPLARVVSSSGLGNTLGILPLAKAGDLYNGTVTSGMAIDQNLRITIGSADYANKSILTGTKLIYELATPDEPTQLTPVTNNIIQVEGNGTIETVQTQSPVIDNSMTVNFDLIP